VSAKHLHPRVRQLYSRSWYVAQGSRQNSSQTNCAAYSPLVRRRIRLPVVQSISDGGVHAHGPAIHFRLEGLSAQRESGRIKKARLREAVSYCYGPKRMADSASRSGET